MDSPDSELISINHIFTVVVYGLSPWVTVTLNKSANQDDNKDSLLRFEAFAWWDRIITSTQALGVRMVNKLTTGYIGAYTHS